LGIEDITKQIRSQVTTHHLKLLTKASSVASLEQPFQSVKNALEQLESNLERLHNKIGNRHATLEDALGRLDRYQAAAELARRTSRFVTLAKRLEFQIAQLDLNPHHRRENNDHEHENTRANKSQFSEQHEIVLAESALTLSELEKLLNSELESASVDLNNTADDSTDPNTQTISSIRSLTAIQPHVQMIVSARKKVEDQMSKILNQGLVQLDRSMLSSSFQTAYNLSILDRSVGSLILELTDLIGKRIKLAFDLNSLARETGANDPQISSTFGYKSRARTEPTSATLPQWTSALWAKLEGLIDDLSTCCVKVYTLEKVLEWKKDPITGVPFLEVVTSAGSMLEERPSTVFWTTLSSALSKETRETLRTSNFIAQTLTANYPHLLRLFQEFFSRIALHTHTIYNSTTQSPETILTLRAVLPIENIYLNRSASKMTEASSGRADKLAAVLANELDAARFDPLLVRSVARKAKEVVDNYLKRLESKIVTDYQSTSLVGPVATSSQTTNIEIFNNLSDLLRLLTRSINEYPDEIKKIMEPSIELTEKIREGIINPILLSIKRELNMIIGKMHNPPRFTTGSNSGGSGAYMRELKAKLNLVRQEILARLDASQLEPILIDLTVELLRSFIFHASLITPLSEAVKLRMAGELAELEFEASQFLVLEPTGRQIGSSTLLVPPNLAGSAGFNDGNDDGREAGRIEVEGQLDNLKIFRQLLFTDRPSEVEELLGQSSLDRLAIVHHLIVKHQSSDSDTAPQVLLIHQRNAWSQAEYFRWVQEYARPAASAPHEPLHILRTYLDDLFLSTAPSDAPPQHPNDQPLPPAASSSLQWLHMARRLLH